MPKTKKNKKGMSEKIASKSKGTDKLNPFNVRFVKSKQNILGRKFKTDVGKPGQARAKAIKKRKDTLLQEFNLKNKSNLFLDKRIGERDSNLSAEEKMIARFTAERVKGAGKNSIFNLGDDINLTHGGEELSKIDKFENPHSDDEEDDMLGKKFVDEAHFGGFMSRADDDFKEGKGNTRKDFIDNLIKESKLKKAEKRKADEEAEEKTQALDSDWKNVFTDMRYLKTGGGKSDVDNPQPVENYDPYDMLVRQMTFEKKEARGGERLKTEEEKIKDERERLEKLEEDRQRRMRGDKEPPRNHVSVEDLGDENVKSANKLSKKEQRKLLKQLLIENAKDGEEGSDDEHDENEGEESGEEEGDEEEDSDEEEDDSDASDNYSDLEDSEDEKENENLVENEKDHHDDQVEEMKTAAAAEIPYLIPVPETYPDLSKLLWGRSPSDLTTILDRILSSNHPQLGDHKPALITYFSLLLQFLQDTIQAIDPSNPDTVGEKFEFIKVLCPYLAKLAPFFQAEAAKAVLKVVNDHFERWTQQPRPRFPGLDVVLTLHLVHVLFPTSDYRHPVVTPALTLICSILSSARPTDRSSFSQAVLLCTIALEYSLLSKRICPELILCLHGLLFVSGTNHSKRPLPPNKGGNYLAPDESCASLSPSRLKISDALSLVPIDNQFKVDAIHSTLKLVVKVLDLYKETPACKELLNPLVEVCQFINIEYLPSALAELLSTVKSSSFPEKKGKVVKPQKQVAMLRMLEPKIEEDFEPFKKKRTGNRDLLEEQKLRHKLKQERKGARKEIRHDAAFLASEKARRLQAKDKERQEKTKALFSNLANQEGDYNKLLRKKKKKF